MGELDLDRSGPSPLYQQLFEQLAERIAEGVFPQGLRLPPTRQLARRLGVHRNTVIRAYEELADAGFVTGEVGRGTFVQLPAAVRTETAEPSTSQLRWDALVAEAAKAEPLARHERVRRAVDPDAINLARLAPSGDLLPDALLKRCIDHVLRTHGPRALGYAPPDGLPRLRRAIAEDLQRLGVPADADSLVITTGSQQAIDLIARVLIDPGDTVVVDDTTYFGALGVFSASGARLTSVASDPEGPDLAALERLQGAKCMYLMPNSSNPTGRCISSERRRALVEWSRRAGVPLIEDDYAADMLLDDRILPPSLRSLDRNVLYIGTFSKKLIPALRLGFLVCPKELKDRVTALKHAIDLGSSALLQHALAEFLERGYLQAHRRRIREEYRARRDVIEAALEAHLPEGLRAERATVGVTMWIPLPPPLTATDVYEEGLRQGVVVAPSTLNELHPGAGSGVRLTFCAEPSDRLAEGARRLGAAIRTLQERSPSRASDPAVGLV